MRDAAQIALDLEDAEKRLERLQAAILKKQAAEELVGKLTAQLKTAKRKAKEAGWDVEVLLSREGRR